MNDANKYLGIVQDGKFQQLIPTGGSARFTSIQPQESVPPEGGELDLAQYEGSAVMLRGHDQGGWVYSAEVVDKAGPILTTMVRVVLGRQEKSDY